MGEPKTEPLTHAEKVEALCGKYAWIPFSSKDHIAEKRKELELEDRKFGFHGKTSPHLRKALIRSIRKNAARHKKEQRNGSPK